MKLSSSHRELCTPEIEAGNEIGQWVREESSQDNISAQGSKFSFQLCVYIGKTQRTIALYAGFCCFVSAGLSCKAITVGGQLLKAP